MLLSFTGCSVCSLILAAALHATTYSAPVLAVRVYNLAGADAYRVRHAERMAASIFRNAGVELQFADGDPLSPEAYREDASHSMKLPAPPVSEVAVRLLDRVPAGLFRGALGIARPFARSGVQVTVFYDRIRDVASQLGIRPETLMGHTIAHELGHVLLRDCAHAMKGVMRPDWTRREFARPVPFWFTHEEALRFRLALLARR